MANEGEGAVEFTGVTEVFDTFRNALYQANVTSIGIFIFLVIALWAVGKVDDSGLSLWVVFSAVPVETIVFFVGLWLFSFSRGYYGLGYTSSGVVGPVTPNTNVDVQWGDIAAAFIARIIPGIRLRDDRQAYVIKNGLLTVSSQGIGGIVAFSWHDILSVAPLSSQQVKMRRVERFFGIPVGKRNVTLRFGTPKDTEDFLVSVSRFGHSAHTT